MYEEEFRIGFSESIVLLLFLQRVFGVHIVQMASDGMGGYMLPEGEACFDSTAVPETSSNIMNVKDSIG